MIRTSSTINGELITASQVSTIKVFREIQNFTPTTLAKPINFSTVEILKNPSLNKSQTSITSDDINNSENTKIIGSGPSDFANDDTLSLTSQPTETDSSDESDTILNSGDSENEDVITSDLINEFLIEHQNTFKLEDDKFSISEDNFMATVHLIETFNNVLFNIYSNEIEIIKIDFKQFVKSILNRDSGFNKFVSQVIKILIYSNQEFLNEQSIFNMNILDLVNTQLELSLKTIALILFKIFNSNNPYKKVGHNDRSNLLHKRDGPLEERIESVEDLNELSIDEKLELFKCFVDTILIKKTKPYRSIIEKIEDEMGKTLRSLSRLRQHRESLEFKFRNVNHFIFDNDDSFHDQNYFTTIQNQVNEKNKFYIDLNNQFVSLMRKEPLGRLDVKNENYMLYFWHFDCLNNNLMIEKRHKTCNYELDNNHFDFGLEKSSWYLISDLNTLKSLITVISTNIFDSSIVNEMLNVIEKSNVKTPEVTQSSEEPVDVVSDHSNFLELMSDFRKRLADANFIDFSLVFGHDNSVKGFALDECYKKFDELISSLKNNDQSSKDKNVKSYIELVTTLYGMIERKNVNNKFTSSHEAYWTALVNNSKSLEQIKFAVFILDFNIHWEKTKISEICNLCKLNSCENLSYEDKITIQCKNCPLSFHLKCLLSNESISDQTDLNNNEVPVKIFKVDKYGKLACSTCCKALEEKNKQMMEIKKAEIAQIDKELVSIEVNSYSLRLNKKRVENLDKQIHEKEKVSKRKTRKSIVTSSTDDTKSTDTDFEPKKRTRRKTVIESTSSSDTVYEPKTRTRTRKRKSDTTDSECNYEAKRVEVEQDQVHIDERRAGLGLRVRPKKTNRMF